MESQIETIAKKMGREDNEQVTGHSLWTRTSVVASEEELNIMFPDTATGEYAWTPSSGVLPPHMIDMDSKGVEIIRQKVPKGESVATKTRKRVECVCGSSSRMVKPKRISMADKLMNALDKIVEAISSDSMTSAATRYPVRDCLQILTEIPGVTVGDQFYLFAVHFLSQCDARREMFSVLPNHQCRLAWLKYEQSLIEKQTTHK